MVDEQSNNEHMDDHHKLKSPFLGGSPHEQHDAEQSQKCPSCGNDIAIVPGAAIKCGCGWSPQAKKAMLLNCLIAVVLVGIAVGCWYVISNYYYLFPDNKRADQMMKDANDMKFDTHQEEAIQLYFKATELSPKRADIRLKLSKLLSYNRPNAALDQAKIAADLDPSNLEANTHYVVCIENFGEWKDAEPIIQRMLQQHPKNLDVLLRGAEFYHKLDQLDKSEDLYRRATKEQKVGDISWANLAAVYDKRGKKVEAIKTLEEGLKVNPQSAQLAFQLGNVYASTNDAAAVPYLKKAVELNPYYTEAVSQLLERVHNKGGNSTHLVRLYRSGLDFLVDVTIGSQNHAWLRVDTGANLCVIPSDVALAAGKHIKYVGRTNIVSVTGTATAPLVVLSSLKVGGAEALNVPAIVYDMPGSSREGLLGISFLDRFKVFMDTKHQQLVLTNRTTAGKK